MSKQITITNGSGKSNLDNGSYNVTASANGYDNTTINPSTLMVVEGTNDYSFSISANGTLTIHVSEDGTSGGTAIVGAKLIRTDAAGNPYGSEQTTDSFGNVTFNNVPYSSTNAPNIYFKQTLSDGDHSFVTSVVTTSMTTQTYTYELQNTKFVERTIILTDANYANLPIESATITLD